MLKLSYEKTIGKSQSSEGNPKTVKEEQEEEAKMGQEDIKDVTAESKRVQPLKKQKQKKPHLM